ncbi:NADH-cytochrome b5 reductase 3-like [Sycon ciliatum]|uniref:NADH-cytochrome b5 reductase 3-like n=1 Tax=Sycon ciliatum TaxID=27933 RepID=UPI0031F60E31
MEWTLVALSGAAGLIGVLAFLFLRQTPSKKSSKSKIALNPKEKIPFKLIEKEVITSDTRRFRFALQTPDHVLGLPIGQHMYLSAMINGQLVVRPYTPVTSDDEIGYFDLVIKVYAAGVHPKFPEGGKMSQYLDGLGINDTIDVRGPSGKLTYMGQGRVTIRTTKEEETRVCKKIGMMAGGTGITPMLQVVRQILKDPEDQTEMFLLFANQTENDILLRDELEEISAKYPERFHLWYTVDTPPKEWRYSSGFIDESMVRRHMPAFDKDVQIFMCGPPPMIKFACVPNLEKVGFTDKQYFAF